jgi:predicted phage terminase large subunit-like protein
MHITLQERQESRRAIARLNDLLTSIEGALVNKAALHPSLSKLLRQLCQTSETENQYAAIEHMLEDAKANYRARLLDAAPHSLSCFAEFMNPEEPPAHHHEWMCSHLEAIAARKIPRSMISMPPGHAKSTYCSKLFPAWYMGNHPNHRYIQGGHTNDFVEKEFGLKVKNMIISEPYHQVFPEITISKESKASGSWALAGKNGTYLTRGVGQGIAGFRAHIAAVDDPYATRADAESAAKRKEVHDWFMADFTTRLLPNAPMFIVATRWHPLDLCGVIEDMTKKGVGIPYHIVNLPAICEDEDDPLGRAIGEALWPNYYTVAILHNLMATLPSRDWNSLYRGKPVDENGGVVKGSWFKRYDVLPKDHINENGQVIRQEVKKITVSVDCASKKGERNDYTVIGVWIEGVDGRHYLAEVIRRRMEFAEMSQAIDDTCRVWRAHQLLVEDKGSGTQYIQMRTTGGVTPPCPLIPIEVGQQSKEFRFDGVTPMLEAGEVLFPEHAIWLPDYEAELLGFPGGTPHDDQVDMTSQYLARVRARRRGGTRKLLGAGSATTREPMRYQGAASRLAERSGRIG